MHGMTVTDNTSSPPRRSYSRLLIFVGGAICGVLALLVIAGISYQSKSAVTAHASGDSAFVTVCGARPNELGKIDTALCETIFSEAVQQFKAKGRISHPGADADGQRCEREFSTSPIGYTRCLMAVVRVRDHLSH